MATATRIQKALGDLTPMALAHEITVSGSIGVASFPDDGRTASELMAAADKAMYTAKSRGEIGS